MTFTNTIDENKVRYTNYYVCDDGCKNTGITISVGGNKTKDVKNLVYEQAKDLRCKRCGSDMMFSFGCVKRS